MKEFLTIIVPIFKVEEEYFRACLESMVHQGRTDYRIILVDDGSPDNSGQICDEYAEKYPFITVVHQPNSGVSVARNTGLKMTATEWTAFVDPDDWIERDYIDTIYNTLAANDADIFLFDYFQEYDGRQFEKAFPAERGMLDELHTAALKIAPFNALRLNGQTYEYETNTIWNKVYRTSIIKNAGLLFDPLARKGQDVIFNTECFQLTNRYYYMRKTLYHYRYLQSSITNRFNSKAQYYNELAFDHYERVIKKYRLPEEYTEAYYARVVTRLYSCMRLYYFHPENTDSKKQVKAALNKTMDSYPYSVAVKKVKSELLTKSQRVFVFFLKRRKYGVLRLLVNGRLALKNIKGARLK